MTWQISTDGAAAMDSVREKMEDVMLDESEAEWYEWLGCSSEVESVIERRLADVANPLMRSLARGMLQRNPDMRGAYEPASNGWKPPDGVGGGAGGGVDAPRAMWSEMWRPWLADGGRFLSYAARADEIADARALRISQIWEAMTNGSMTPTMALLPIMLNLLLQSAAQSPQYMLTHVIPQLLRSEGDNSLLWILLALQGILSVQRLDGVSAALAKCIHAKRPHPDAPAPIVYINACRYLHWSVETSADITRLRQFIRFNLSLLDGFKDKPLERITHMGVDPLHLLLLRVKEGEMMHKISPQVLDYMQTYAIGMLRTATSNTMGTARQ
eukprot:gene637-1069_t